MHPSDLLQMRLASQLLGTATQRTPADVIDHFGAMQSQDYNGAMWAVAQRTEHVTATDVGAAVARGAILRTHVMRPTWHFVSPDDIVWLLDVSRDRLLSTFSYYFRKYDLNDAIFKQTDAIIINMLADGTHATRKELARALTNKKVDVSDLIRLTHIIFHAEIMGYICSGVPRGKQQTYALLEERAPHARHLDRSSALTELAYRYFSSHGPATLEDFAWWAGLTKRDAQKGIEGSARRLKTIEKSDTLYWYTASPLSATAANEAYFLPNYDEYLVAYANRDNLFDLARKEHLDSRQNPLFNNVLIVKGIAVATWKKTEHSREATLALTPFRTFTSGEMESIVRAAQRYGRYLQKTVTIEGI